MHGADVEPATNVPFRANVSLRALPGLGLTTTESSPARYARTRRFLADGRDYFGLHLSFAGDGCGQRGQEIACGPRAGVLMNVAEAGWIVSPDDAVLGPVVSSRQADPARGRSRRQGAAANRVGYGGDAILVSYVRYLDDQQTLADPELARIAAAACATFSRSCSEPGATLPSSPKGAACALLACRRSSAILSTTSARAD